MTRPAITGQAASGSFALPRVGRNVDTIVCITEYR